MATPKKKSETMIGNSWPWMQMMTPAIKDNEAQADLANIYGDIMRAGQEFTDLCARRTRAYMELPKMVSECKNPEDLAEVEIEFWNMAYDQYKDYSSHSLPGPLAALGGMIEGQIPHGTPKRSAKAKTRTAPRAAAKATAKSQAKRKGPTKRKSTRRRSTGNGSGVYSFPEHVGGSPETRGRMH